MARVTITIEDSPDGKVKIVSDPSFDTIAKMEISGHSLSAAHGYALVCINAVRKVSKEMANELKVFLPRIGR